MNKGIWAGLVAIAFVAGSIMTGTMAYAASNAQGQPFQQIQEQIEEIQFQVDSFFDIMYRITVPTCEEGERPTLNSENDGYTCVPRAGFDSFFDITVDNAAKIETEILALELHSADPAAHHDPSGGGVTLGSLECGEGEVAKISRGSWICSRDRDEQRFQFDEELLDVVIPAGRSQGFSIFCPPGHFVLDHGYSGLAPGNEIIHDFPDSTQSGFRHFWQIQNNGDEDNRVRLHLLCGRLN